MSLTLIFIALVTNLMCFFYDYKNKNTFLFIWMLNVVFVLYPISVSYFSEYQIEIDSSLMFISICNFTYLVSSIVIRSMLRRESGFKVDFSQSVNFTYKWLVWILALSIPLIFIFKGISLSTIMQSDLTTKRQLGFFYLFVILLCAFVFPNVVLFYKQKDKISVSIVLAVFVLVLLFFRSRSVLSYIALPIAFYILYNTKHGLFKLSLFGVCAYFFSQLVKVIRYQGSLSDGLDISRWGESFNYVTSNSIDSGDLSIYKIYLNIISDCEFYSWCGSWTYIQKIASWFLPGLEKIKTIEYLLYEEYVQAGVGGSLHPLSYGIAYSEGGGILGAVYFIFLAILSELNGRMIEKSFYIFSGFSMYFCLFFSRGSVYNGLFVI
ncbi:hypothetical protein CVA87_RS22030, partial [Vibrio parahaemolyticus]|nr:hypothetical protein [Vibrio parahaemolyticus]